jgi:hypothetical protein
LPIEADQGFATLAAREMERIGKVQTLPVPFQGSPHQVFLFQMEMA